MDIRYKSTRNSSDETVSSSYAILKGLADDGGLYVPVSFPKLDKTIEELSQMTYQEIARQMEKEPKSIDNALQRIKTKVNKELKR